MKGLISTILFVVVATIARGQINIIRYNDNFSHLRGDSIARQGFDRLRQMPVFRSGIVSLGGELREQLQHYRNLNFGDAPASTDWPGTWQLWHRAMVHANIETGKRLRIFTQLGSTFRFLNPNPATPEIDENHLSLHQLFGEYRLAGKMLVRIGRQETSYGSHRLITFREGPNTRLAFDAALLKYHNDKRAIDLLVLSPVVSRKGVFDDATFKDFIVGVYGSERIGHRTLSADYYFLNFESGRRRYNYLNGHDSRRIIGFRLFSDTQRVNYELEVNYQFGKFNDLNINAYGIFADVHDNLLPNGKLILGIGGNYGSGDRIKGDHNLNTYNSLFSKPPYGLTAPIGANNIVAINPYLRSNMARRMNILAGTYLMWRQSDEDGTYTPAGTQIRPQSGKMYAIKTKSLGTLLAIETNYNVDHHFSCAIDASYFLAGKYIAQAGQGKNITYLSLKIGYKF